MLRLVMWGDVAFGGINCLILLGKAFYLIFVFLRYMYIDYAVTSIVCDE